MTERPHDYRRYKINGPTRCRCFSCRTDNSHYLREYRAGRGARAVDYIPAATVVEHLNRLSAQGVGHRRVAVLAGVPESTVRRWLFRGVTLARRDLAEKVLAVEAPPPARRWPGAIGTQRRVKALVSLGWSVAELARRIGRSRQMLDQVFERSEVFPRTETAITALYDDLWDQPPEPSQWVAKSKRVARRNRYFPPQAWDDETIDDPEVLPCMLPPVTPVDLALELAVQHVAAGHDIEIDRETRAEFVRRTLDWPVSRITEALRCSVSTVTIDRRRFTC